MEERREERGIKKTNKEKPLLKKSSLLSTGSKDFKIGYTSNKKIPYSTRKVNNTTSKLLKMTIDYYKNSSRIFNYGSKLCKLHAKFQFRLKK